MISGSRDEPYAKATLWKGIMDCRVRPGNDSGEAEQAHRTLGVMRGLDPRIHDERQQR
jgi:hypothetical protein